MNNKILVYSAVFILCFFSGCATFRAHPPSASAVKKRLKVVRTARQYVGKHKIVVEGKKYLFDCSNFVRAVYMSVCDIDLYSGAKPGINGVQLIYDYCKKNGYIDQEGFGSLADLVFFRDTYDVKKKRKTQSGNLTHIGIVEKISRDGTITFIHLNSQGIVKGKLNLDHPHDKNKNSYLRRKKGSNGGEYLAGELFVAFGTVID